MSDGFHHLSLVCSNARRTLRFYTQVLGLRLVKTTVDFDNPEHYHLYFGDAHGTPGTLISAYEWHIALKGAPGVGGVGGVALGVNDLAGWQRRLAEQDVTCEGPFEREGAPALRLRDPDGMQIELVEDSLAGATPRIYQLSCLSADLSLPGEFYGGVLGMQAIQLPDEGGIARLGWGVGGKALLMFEQDAAEQPFPVRKGIGQPHHFALAVPDVGTLGTAREKLLMSGWLASEILDRAYYQSVLTRDPDGQLVELSTLEPGVLVDESPEELGKGLMLPDWLEAYRGEIEENLEYLG
jgi:glyoxalase family protein